MHAFITASQTQSQSLSQIPLDQPHPDLFVIDPESSIGIDDIRDIKHQLVLPPFQTVEKIFYFPQAEKLTLPAQNALLKSLEEPPPRVKFILQTNQISSLLPTVISRCTIISSSKKAVLSDSTAASKISELLRQLDTHFSKIHLANQYAKKDAALLLISELTDYYRSQLHRNPHNFQYRDNLKLLINTHKYIEANTNIQLAVENLFLNLHTE